MRKKGSCGNPFDIEHPELGHCPVDSRKCVSGSFSLASVGAEKKAGLVKLGDKEEMSYSPGSRNREGCHSQWVGLSTLVNATAVLLNLDKPSLSLFSPS